MGARTAHVTISVHTRPPAPRPPLRPLADMVDGLAADVDAHVARIRELCARGEELAAEMRARFVELERSAR